MKLQHLFARTALAGIVFLGLQACEPSGDNPQPATDSRDKFVGTFICQENSNVFGPQSFQVTIRKSNSDNENILITNFYNLGSGTTTIVGVSGNSLTLRQQVVSGQTMQGSGSYTSNGKFNMNYTADDGITVNNATASFTKQ